MDITNCSKEELAQAVLELTIELGKTRRALNAAKQLAKEPFCYSTKLPAIDPMAVDPRSVV